MKPLIASLLLLAVPSLGFARFMHWMSQYEMFDEAALVVFAVPVSTKDTGEKLHESNWAEFVGVETEFEIQSVLKGDKTLKTFVLHHYRLAEHSNPINGPSLVSFDLHHRESYVLHLVKEPDGRYAPVNDQIDPANVIYKKPAVYPIEEPGAFKSLHWITETTQQDIATKAIITRVKGEHWYKHPDLLLTIRTPEEKEGPGSKFTYRKKKAFYICFERMGCVHMDRHEPYPAEDFTGGVLGISARRQVNDYKKIGSGTVCGRLCDICEQISVSGMKVWLMKQNGFIMRSESVSNPPRVERASLFVTTVTKIEVDIPLEDSLFEIADRFRNRLTDNDPAKWRRRDN